MYMDIPLRALILDDSEDDAQLLVRELKRSYTLTYERVDSAAGMRAALADRQWDIILSDYSMPDFNALNALKVLHEAALDLPFIIVSGTIIEEEAVAALKAGAGDFIVKGRLSRLGPAIERELREAKNRAKRHRAEERLATTLDTIIEGAQIIGFDWHYVYVNEAVAIRGRQSREALLGHTMMEVYPGIEHTELFTVLSRCMTSRVAVRMENEFVYPDGSKNWFDLNIQPVPEGLFMLSHDISERKRAEANTRRQLDRLAALRTIDMAISGSLSLDLTLSIILQQVTSQLGVDAANVLLHNRSTHELVFAAGRGFRTSAFRQSRPHVGEGHAGRAALERRIIAVPDLRASERKSRRTGLLDSETFVSYFAVPLIAKGEVKGVLEIFHRAPLDPDPNWMDFLESLAGQAAIGIDQAELFRDLQQSNADLSRAYDATIEGWSRALDLRDHETEGHSQRVTDLTVRLAQAIGMDSDQLVHVRRGALLHDIGKMGVPDNVLLKEGPLTDDEWIIMRRHPALAYELLQPIEYLRHALDIPYCHHEKWDGSGYPRGLAGAAIPLSARIFAVVDVSDALRSRRPYRQAWAADKVLEHIRHSAGQHFDPRVVEAFLAMMAASP